MLEQQLYVREKMLEADAARRDTELIREASHRKPRTARGPIGPIVRVAGRRVRRVGEALESWATPQTAAR